MATTIKITLPIGETIYDGKLTSFVAPCSCDGVTTLGVKEADATEYTSYSLVDAADVPVSDIPDAFVSGSTVRVILNGSKAVIQNASYERKHKSTTITLAVASWSSLAQTVSVDGVTADNDIIVSPAPASQEAYIKAGVYCSAQAAGTLTFTCKTAPTVALTVNIMIMGG